MWTNSDVFKSNNDNLEQSIPLMCTLDSGLSTTELATTEHSPTLLLKSAKGFSNTRICRTGYGTDYSPEVLLNPERGTGIVESVMTKLFFFKIFQGQ